MFGSSFFYIQSCSNHAIVSPCILAVNQNGLSFLSKETHVGVGWGPSDGGTPRSLLQAGVSHEERQGLISPSQHSGDP